MKMDMSKSINDKAFTSKVEAKNYDRIGRLFKDEDCVSLSLTVHIPYKNRNHAVYDTNFDADVVGTWAQHLIVALEERQYECQTDLLSNIKNVESNDGSVIEYNVGNNRVRSFNCVTFSEIIWEAIHTLKNDVTEFCKNSSYAEQALKALVDYKLPVNEIKGINVEDLRTALFHILMTKR